MGEDWKKALRKQIQPAIAAGEQSFQETEEYKLTWGEVMLELTITQKDESNLEISLEQRKKPIYTYEGEETDIAELSGIKVPERQNLGSIPLSKLEEGLLEPGKVVFGDGRAADMQSLTQAVYALFTTIRGYEQQMIMHFAGVTATGEGRKAHVSVTGMDLLRKFDVPELKDIPSTYHTKYANPGDVRLPAQGNMLYLPIPVVGGKN